jgi:hypothetical protein
VVIGIKFDKENHGSIFANCRTDPRIKLDGLVDQILVVKITKKSHVKFKISMTWVVFISIN